MPPILAAHEHDPMPAFLTTVGSSSAVNMYTMANADAAAALPTNARRMVNTCKSEIHRDSCVEMLYMY